jgi:demethylmenaquinone methyltransferase/2-methoxy-6-polyprenyl-1,4-benzoquinol methylase
MVHDMSIDEPRSNNDSFVPFGEQNVPTNEKEALVREVFNNVASRYDLMNDLMSAGLHRLWKQKLVDKILEHPTNHLLDLAGGSGDIALSFLQQAKNEITQITVCDINFEMLMVGRNKAWDNGHLDKICWMCGNGEALPFPSSHFDICTLSFGLRNMTHPEVAIAEIYRVLKPGGRFLLLEFTPDVIPALQKLYEIYSQRVIPRIGRQFAKNMEAYVYLVESIRRFYKAEEITRLLKAHGFAGIRNRKLTAGIASLHSAWRA